MVSQILLSFLRVPTSRQALHTSKTETGENEDICPTTSFLFFKTSNLSFITCLRLGQPTLLLGPQMSLTQPLSTIRDIKETLVSTVLTQPLSAITAAKMMSDPKNLNSLYQTPDSRVSRLVICIGDIHGYFTKLQNLWSNLKSQSTPSLFNQALIIFLGDYCDRGPDTKKVIDFLLSLPTAYPEQKHVFLAGNHDFAFAAFVGAVPPPADGSSFKDGWREYEESEDREGWYKGYGFENMHLQGRRWSGSIKVKFNTAKGTEYKGSIYDAGPTFESYGVPHGSADLMKAVSDEHKKFLADMVWVHEEDDVCIETADGLKHCRLIAVHAGLEKGLDVEQQLKALRTKDTSIPKIQNLSGRKNVWEIPEELNAKPTIVVSGHHGKLHIDGLRLIIDEGGGYEHKPVAAVILPFMKIVRDTD